MPNTKSVGVAYSDPALTSFYLNAPVTKTASFTLGEDENYVICNGSAANVTVTVISASSNVKPRTSNTAATAILAASAGAFATLVCEDGTNWVVMAGN